MHLNVKDILTTLRAFIVSDGVAKNLAFEVQTTHPLILKYPLQFGVVSLAKISSEYPHHTIDTLSRTRLIQHPFLKFKILSGGL